MNRSYNDFMKILQVLSIVLIAFSACKKSTSTDKPEPVNPPVDNRMPAGQKSDKDSWIRDKATGHPKEYPLLFDDGYKKKTAYSGFLEGLR